MDKLEYILCQFHRTLNKKYENYCVERIINLIDNPNLQFVTQQMFRREEKHIALADLYFPQIKLSVEIDEEYHKSNKERDEARKADIIERIKRYESIISIVSDRIFEPKEMHIDASRGQTLKSINDQIDEIIAEIKKRIDQIPNMNWNPEVLTPEYYISRGVITADEGASFRTLWDVSKLFAKGYKEGCQVSWFEAEKGNSHSEMVWCPKIKMSLEGYREKVPYENEMSLDAGMILESADSDNQSFVQSYLSEPNSKEIRYIFPRYKTSSGKFYYVFKGVYVLDIEQTKNLNKRVWIRVSTKLEISKYHNKTTS